MVFFCLYVTILFFVVISNMNKTLIKLLPLIYFLSLSYFELSAQYYVRNKQNIGIAAGFSSSLREDQKNFSVGISSQINRYMIPEINYRNSTNFDNRIASDLGSNLHFISPGLQFKKRILSTPGRKVRGICVKEFLELAITPEYHFLINPSMENKNNRDAFALRGSLIIFRYKSGSSRARKAWSYKLEGYYRQGFGSQTNIKKEVGIQFRITRFKIQNFLN